MDTLRGTFDSHEAADAKAYEDDTLDNAVATEGLRDDEDAQAGAQRDVTPPQIGQDERRMQVRAYNHWAGLLEDRNFPAIEDLDPESLPDFGPFSVVLDFTEGVDDPIVRYLGEKLGDECGAQGTIERLSDVPPRSLLSRITDHYMQIIANQAPIGFEAEFVNQRGASILYRGILLPFSSDDETIDFLCGVINWKEMADAATADELLLEIDQALEATEEEEIEADIRPHHAGEMTDWADSPAHEEGSISEEEPAQYIDHDHAPADFSVEAAALHAPADVFGAGSQERGSEEAGAADPQSTLPDFGQYGLEDPEEDEEAEDDSAYSFASLADYIEAPAKKAIDLDADSFDPSDYRVETASEDLPQPRPLAHFGREASPPLELKAPADFAANTNAEAPAATPEDAAEPDNEPKAKQDTPSEVEIEELAHDASLMDCLASARALAQSARASEDRSRHALYAAVSRAYDVSLAAQDDPDQYTSLIEENGLTVQDRAPMTPVVKLVFGSEYDKTRLTEYAAVLSHAHRLELERGSLSTFLREADGGLKGVVKAERALRREESGKAPVPEATIRAQLAKKLRELEALTFEAIEAAGPEFALIMVRRDGQGGIDVLGEIEEDISLIERAGKSLLT